MLFTQSGFHLLASPSKWKNDTWSSLPVLSLSKGVSVVKLVRFIGGNLCPFLVRVCLS
jgi:hypothetical protein